MPHWLSCLPSMWGQKEQVLPRAGSWGFWPGSVRGENCPPLSPRLPNLSHQPGFCTHACSAGGRRLHRVPPGFARVSVLSVGRGSGGPGCQASPSPAGFICFSGLTRKVFSTPTPAPEEPLPVSGCPKSPRCSSRLRLSGCCVFEPLSPSASPVGMRELVPL